MTAQNSLVLYETKDLIASITLNRPERSNALNSSMMAELNQTWRRFEEDASARVAIIAGAGKAFGTGRDTSEAEVAFGAADIATVFPGIGVAVTKPIIAAIRGYCLGGSLGLALCCDIRIAALSARFGLPEVKVGFAGQGLSDIVDYVPLGVAMEILLTGDFFDAERAYQIGLVNKVTSEDALMGEATKMAQKIARNAPLALKSVKLLAYKRAWGPLAQVRMDYYNLIKPQLESEDLKEGLKAFREKRKPEFKNR